MRVYSRIFSYVLKYPVLFMFCIFFALTLVAGKVGGILQVSDMFSTSFIENNMGKIDFFSVLLLLGLIVLWAGSHYLVFVASNTLSAKVMHDLRRDIYKKLVDFPLSYYKNNRAGEILSRILNDIGIIEIFLMNIIVEIIAQPLTVVAIVTVMILTNPQISLYFFSIVPVLGVVLGGLGGLVSNLSMKVQKNISDITSSIQETVYGIEVIKGYGVEENIKEGFLHKNDEHLKSIKKELKIRLLGTPVSEFLGACGVIIIIVLGGIGVSQGIAESKDIVRFITLAMVLSEPLSLASSIFMVLRKLKPAAQRVFEIIDSDETEKLDLPPIGEIKGAIRYENLHFRYDDDREILFGIDFDIRAGETIALVGPSGSGKSTLISLIPAFYYASVGRLTIDGSDIRDVHPHSIRTQLSVVTQEPILFSGTIIDNIRLSKTDATEDEVIEASRLANAHHFIEKLPLGYQTVLGDRGVRISGGERQRIVLARAILRKPKILILDEATSSLDAESEHQIQKAMKNILGKQTTIIVAHKLSTIMDADKIVVIEGGKIIEVGTHQELLEAKGIYNKLYGLQINV